MREGLYFRETTFHQRTVLFKEWERLNRKYGAIAQACKKAHVSRQVFYDWVERYMEYGIEGLRRPISHAPNHPRERVPEIKEDVAKIKKKHLTWGLHKIGAEVSRMQGSSMPSPNTVKKALILEGIFFRSK